MVAVRACTHAHREAGAYNNFARTETGAVYIFNRSSYRRGAYVCTAVHSLVSKERLMYKYDVCVCAKVKSLEGGGGVKQE